MKEEDERDNDNIFGDDYKEYLNNGNHHNPSMNTGKIDTSEETPRFEKIDKADNYHPMTELNKPDKKTKEKTKKHKKSLALISSSSESKELLQKKTSRAGDGKKKKTKSEMELTFQNKTEIRPEKNKKDIDQKVYEMFNNPEPFIDVYEQNHNENIINEESLDPDKFYDDNDQDAEVNQEKPTYKTEINKTIPETFNMIFDSE